MVSVCNCNCGTTGCTLRRSQLPVFLVPLWIFSCAPVSAVPKICELNFSFEGVSNFFMREKKEVTSQVLQSALKVGSHRRCVTSRRAQGAGGDVLHKSVSCDGEYNLFLLREGTTEYLNPSSALLLDKQLTDKMRLSSWTTTLPSEKNN